MRSFIIYLLIIISSGNSLAQFQYPIFTQNYSNPYLINPSQAASAGIPEVNVTFRQQWVQVKNGPQTLQADFQYPINTRMAVAANVYNDKTILLSNTGFVGTFVFKVPLSSAQSLGFGLSAGVLSNRIDINNLPALDLVDPVLTKSANNMNLTGQFGMHYRYKRFVLGVSLLNLLDNSPLASESFKLDGKSFTPFRDKTVHISYSSKLTRELGLTTNLIYRSTDFNGDYFQGTAMLNLNGRIDVGGGYRTDFGPHVALRLRIKALHAGYAYDFPSKNYGSSTGGSNELQLKWQFGEDYASIENDTMSTRQGVHKKKTVSKPATQDVPPEDGAEKEITPPQNEAKVVAQVEEKPPVKQEEVKPIKAEEEKPKVIIAEAIPAKTEISPPVKEEPIVEKTSPPATKFLLVVGAFAIKEHAENFVKQLKEQGVEAEIKTKAGSPLHFVHVPKYTSDTVDLNKVNEIRQNTQFKDAWFVSFD